MDRETKFKEAIKIGLAIVIGYYVAMRMDWMSPTWIAISIAMVSLPTAGQSLQKGALRMGGTLVAFVVGLFYLSLFPQDRWLFVLSMSPYLFLVAYMVQGRNGQYFWFVAGFVTMMITTAGPGSSEHAFEFAAYRTLETLAGIVIWTLVSIFIWPRSNRGALEKTLHALLDAHQKLMGGYATRLTGAQAGAEDQAIQPIRAEAGKLVTQLETTIGAAAAESYEVHEVRPLWLRLGGLFESVIGVLDRLESGFAETQKIHPEKVMPQMEALFKELTARFEEAQNLLDGKEPNRSPEKLSLDLDDAELNQLDHFRRAAVEVTRSELMQLQELGEAIRDCVADLKGLKSEKRKPASAEKSHAITGPFGLPPLDPDRIRGAVMVTASMWVGFLIWIYINPPGHLTWYQFIPNITLVIVQTQFARPTFFKPFFFAYVVGLTAYVFIMPQLSVFWQLGLLIFAFAFTAAFFFNGISRIAIYLAMFNMLGIQNEQSYDFASSMNAFLFTMTALMAVTVLSYITRSPRPEKAFVRMVSRFFRSCEYLVSCLAEAEPPKSFWGRMKWAFHAQEVRSLPGKLGMWGKQIDPKKFPGVTQEQIGSLVASLEVLVYRIEDLRDQRGAPQADLLVRELTEDMRAWRIVIQQGCEKFAGNPDAEPAQELREKLKARLAALNHRIERAINDAGEESISLKETENFYRLLGGFRGFSEAALVYADTAESIDWSQLREERF